MTLPDQAATSKILGRSTRIPCAAKDRSHLYPTDWASLETILAGVASWSLRSKSMLHRNDELPDRQVRKDEYAFDQPPFEARTSGSCSLAGIGRL